MASHSKSKKYKERKFWTLMQEQKLVQLWEKHFVELHRHRKNMHVYAEIANTLGAMNIVFTPEEVKSKIHNLTNRYRNEKKSIALSGDSHSEWKLFNKIHRILGRRKKFNGEPLDHERIVEDEEGMAPWSDLQHSYDSISNVSANSSDFDSSSSNTSTQRAAKRRKKDDLDKVIRKTLKAIQATSQEFLQIYAEIEKERNDHLKELIEILKN